MNEERIFNALTTVLRVIIGIGTLVYAGLFFMHACELGINAMHGAVVHGNLAAILLLDAVAAAFLFCMGLTALLPHR